MSGTQQVEHMCQDSDDRETSDSLYCRGTALVEQDNKDEFVSLINRASLYDKEALYDKTAIVLNVGLCDAANCLAAILDGEVGQSLVTYYLSDLCKNLPLHNAARGARPRITSLLLDKGYSADFRTDFISTQICLQNALPLNVSLDSARFHLWRFYTWQSPIHQIIRLCRWERHHKTIRLIARNTKEIKHEFFKYLKQGNVFEAGALLAIASDLIMSSPSTTDGENGSIGFKNIMEMRQFLLTEMSRSLGASDTQLKEIKKTLRLLEIFDRVGDKLLAHMPMWDNNTSDSGIGVASLIEDAAYDEEEEVEYDHDAVPRAYYTLPYCVEAKTEYYSYHGEYYSYHGRHGDSSKEKFSTKVHFPSSLEEESCHVDEPLSLPLIPKGAVTKHFLSKKHASFIGAFAKAVRHLRYR